MSVNGLVADAAEAAEKLLSDVGKWFATPLNRRAAREENAKLS